MSDNGHPYFLCKHLLNVNVIFVRVVLMHYITIMLFIICLSTGLSFGEPLEIP